MIKYYCDKCGAELTANNRFIIRNNYDAGILKITIEPTVRIDDEIFGRCCMMQEVRFLVENRYYQVSAK